jgi:hypothetical protein
LFVGDDDHIVPWLWQLAIVTATTASATVIVAHSILVSTTTANDNKDKYNP